MPPLNKKIIIALLLMVVLLPVGILLPHWFEAGDAWGEWSPESVNKVLGFTPKGMEHDASTWNAPLPDYSNGNEQNSLTKNTLYYIISGLIGVGFIAIITFVLHTFAKKRKT